MEKLMIMGHIGKDAVVKEFNGVNKLAFNVAVTEKFKTKEGIEKEKTNWWACYYNLGTRNESGLLKYLTKGNFICVEGKPSFGLWKDEKGQTNINLTINLSNIHLMPNSKKEQAAEQITTQSHETVSTESDSDLPY